MPKLSMKTGERMFLEFVSPNNGLINQCLVVDFVDDEQGILVSVFRVDEEGMPEKDSMQTMFSFTPPQKAEEPEPTDECVKSFLDMMEEVFGPVYTVDEHGIRRAKREGNN